MKKVIAWIVALTLVGGLAGGAVYYKNTKGGKAVSVYALDDLVTSYWGDENESYGDVTTDQTQSVYLSSTQIVQEVLVKEGQTVKKGDVLMTYDTTLSQVELEKKSLAIQKLELELTTARSNLEKIKTYRPGKSIPRKDQIDSTYSGFGAMTMGGWKDLAVMLLAGDLTANTSEIESSGEGLEEPGESKQEPEESKQESGEQTESSKETGSGSDPTNPTKPTEPSSTETQAPDKPDYDPVPAPTSFPERLQGSGTQTSPYVYHWNKTWELSDKFLEHLANGKNPAYVVLQMITVENPTGGPENIALNGAASEVTYPDGTWYKLKINRYGSGSNTRYASEMISMSVDGFVVKLQPDPAIPDEAPTESDEPDFPGWGGGGFSSSVKYSAKEIADMLAEASEKVRDLDLELRTAQSEYNKMERELNNGSVVSEIDGVIVTVRDEETANLEGQPLIDVSGGGGYYIRGTVSELKLDGIHVGMPVTVMSYETYNSYEGVIQEISDYPAGRGYYDYNGNANVSYYYYTVFVDESADLKEYEWVSLKYQADTQNPNAMYLSNYMIRTENGSSYIYVANEAGRLEKRTIRTGRSLWGSYTQVLSGLTMEDRLAFPYGKNVKEGAPTVEASTDELWNNY